MALGLTFLHDANGQVGQLRTQMVDVTFDDDYPEGGYPMAGNDAGVGSFIYGSQEAGSNSVGLLYRASYNPETRKLQVSGLTERTSEYSTALDGSTNPDGTEGNADQVAGPVNFDLLFAGDTLGNLTDYTVTPVTSPDVPRNMMLTLENNSGGALDLFEGVTTFTITGTDVNDEALVEEVTLTSTALNQEVADTAFRYLQGVKAFKTVDTILITNPPADDFTIYVGPGSRIGIPTALQTPSYQDVVSATVNAAPLTISSTTADAGGVDASNNTINVGTIADADDLIVDYNPTSEEADGANLSAVRKRIVFLGV